MKKKNVKTYKRWQHGADTMKDELFIVEETQTKT